ncbi:hypothetical protein JHK85_016614 [Glycine max]|nr:hypothetical protein JHK85_016614 [Glycine max]
MDPKHKLDGAKPPSGDYLFDVLGVDLKNQLLNGNWDNLFTYELDANAENMDKKIAPMNMQGATTSPDIYSVKEAISDNDIFFGMGTDHLLDVMVSKAKSIVKQDSDDMSYRTTLTWNCATKTSFLRFGCNKDDAGNCSQTSSIYGSQLSSWVKNSGSVK